MSDVYGILITAFGILLILLFVEDQVKKTRKVNKKLALMKKLDNEEKYYRFRGWSCVMNEGKYYAGFGNATKEVIEREKVVYIGKFKNIIWVEVPNDQTR
jgi:hypothetical protein